MTSFVGYLALGTIDPVSGVFAEISGGGYARRPVIIADQPAASGGAVQNGGELSNPSDVVFPVVTGADWPKVTAYAVFDALTGGAPILYWGISSAVATALRVGRQWTVRAEHIRFRPAQGGFITTHGSAVVLATPVGAPLPAVAAEAPLDFLDDFTVGTQGPFTSGRVPNGGGANPWTVSGAGAAYALVGGPSGFTIASGNNAGNIYAIMVMNSGQVPYEIGVTFVAASAGVAPTIAILKAPPDINVMFHANANTGPFVFLPGYWYQGQVNVPPADGMADYGTSAAGVALTSVTLTPGLEYTRLIYPDPPYFTESIEDATGQVLAAARYYDPNFVNVVGPGLFIEVGGDTNMQHRRVWARNKPKGGVSKRGASFPAGLEGTPVGNKVRSRGAFSQVVAGAASLGGAVLGAIWSVTNRKPVFKAVGIAAQIEVTSAGSAGNDAEIQLTNGNSLTAGVRHKGSGNVELYSAQTTFGTMVWNDCFTFPSGFRPHGSSSGRRMAGTAAPTSGTFQRGDHVDNNLPAVGSPKGWTCTASGTPGTWVSDGNL